MSNYRYDLWQQKKSPIFFFLYFFFRILGYLTIPIQYEGRSLELNLPVCSGACSGNDA